MAPNVHDFNKEREKRQADDEKPPTGWERIDLTDIVNGKRSAPPPTIGRRKDGPCLFYRGRVNGVHGESESSKTWICLVAAAEELFAGNSVLYLDYEDDALGIVGRLMALGVPGDVIVARFHYRNPETAITAPVLAELQEEVKGCTLVIIDATTEAMQVEGLKDKEAVDVAAFHNRISRPLAKCGPAVVVVDHVVKDEGARHLGPLGSQHKRAGITGTSIYVECIVRLVRGDKGRSRLYVSKDRPGYVRAETTRTESGMHHWGDFAADATDPDDLLVTLWPPFTEDGTPTAEKGGKRTEEDVCQAIWDVIPTMKAPPTQSALYDRIKGNKAQFTQALARMVDADHLLVGDGKRGALLYTRGPSPWPPPHEEEIRAEDLIA